MALARAHREILAGFDRREGRGLDAEWLVDNYPVIDDVLREIKQDLPSGYDAELPKLAVEPLEGYPRVFALALALVAHTDSGLDEAQDHAVRRRVPVGRAADDRRALGGADDAPARPAGEPPAAGRRDAPRPRGPSPGRRVGRGPPGGVARRGGREGSPDDRHAADGRRVEGLRRPPARTAPRPGPRRARRRSTGSRPTCDRHGVDPDEVLREEHRRQAANQVSIGNAVTSLRLLAALDWNAFFERSSRVEAVLRDDPAGVYARQDFFTRDRTRQAVERIAKGSGLEEVEVARRAVERAEAGLARARRGARSATTCSTRGSAASRTSSSYKPKGRERAASVRARPSPARLLRLDRPADARARRAVRGPRAARSGRGWSR